MRIGGAREGVAYGRIARPIDGAGERRRTAIEEELESLCDAVYAEIERDQANRDQAWDAGGDPFCFTGSLAVRNGFLTVRDDLLANGGQKFLQIMDRLSELVSERPCFARCHAPLTACVAWCGRRAWKHDDNRQQRAPRSDEMATPGVMDAWTAEGCASTAPAVGAELVSDDISSDSYGNGPDDEPGDGSVPEVRYGLRTVAHLPSCDRRSRER